MNIVTRNSDNAVLFEGTDLSVDASGVHGTGWVYPALNNTTATLVQNVTIPIPWVAGAYSYALGTFSVLNQSLIDAENTVLLNSAKQSQSLVIQSAAANAETAPLSFTTAGTVTAMFLMDQNSWTKYLGAYTHYVVHAQALPAGFAFYSATGIAVPFTLTDITNFFTLGLAQIENALNKQATLLAQIAAAASTAQVNAVVW